MNAIIEQLSLIPGWITCLSIGMVITGAGLVLAIVEGRPRNWQRIEGVIIRSVVEKNRLSINSIDATFFAPIVEFEYTLEGRRYQSSRVRLGNYSTGDRASADTICQKYPVSKRVTVFVNPNQPDSAALEYGVSWISVSLILTGATFCLLALACLR